MLRKGARTDPPAVGSAPRRVFGRDRKEAPTLAPDHRTLVERANDLRRFGVDQTRRIELPVRVVLVPPAVGEPLAEPGARDLAAQLGFEAAAGFASADRHRTLDVAKLGLARRRERNDFVVS